MKPKKENIWTTKIEGGINDFDNGPSFFELSQLLSDTKEEEAIKLLKAKGYIIYKPTFKKL